MTARVGVVTDSTSDLDAAAAAAAGITVVPLTVRIGRCTYRDGVDLSRDAFYAALSAGPDLPSTSQPAPQLFADAFRPHVEAGRAVVCLTVMAAVSGTLNAARAAAAQFPGADIQVVDSASVAGGAALQALHAAALARSGADAPAILAALARDRERQGGYAAIPDLSHALRTGRVTRTQALVGSLIRLVPVLRFGAGRIEEEARVRTFARAQETMLAAAVRALGGASAASVWVMHTRAPDAAHDLATRFAAAAGSTACALEVVEAGPAIATHAGPGALAIFVLPADR